MPKKEYILRLLEKLKNTRPIAQGLSFLVQANAVDEYLLDIIIKTIEVSMQTIDDENVKEKLEKAKTFLETMKAKEILSKQQDQKDIQELDIMLQKI
ncbi:MAG: hypothetical protein WC606_01050 [Candidatus Absconditabacterales bacterium]|jgi:hypothetical protein